MSEPDYFLAPSLAELREQVNDKYPKRDKSSDGWIGDARHQAESYSDHNPCWTCTGKLDGVVRALDIDNNGAPGELTPLVKDVLQAAIGDPRVWYVIWDGKIYSRTYGWAPLVYHGVDPHTNHVHVSIQGHNLPSQSGPAAVTAAEDTSKWLQTKRKPVPTTPSLRLHNAKDAARHPHKAIHPVATKRIQRALNARLNAGLTVDGVYGKGTRQAYKAWQRHLGRTGDRVNGIPSQGALTKLGANRFRVVP